MIHTEIHTNEHSSIIRMSATAASFKFLTDMEKQEDNKREVKREKGIRNMNLNKHWQPFVYQTFFYIIKMNGGIKIVTLLQPKLPQRESAAVGGLVQQTLLVEKGKKVGTVSLLKHTYLFFKSNTLTLTCNVSMVAADVRIKEVNSLIK